MSFSLKRLSLRRHDVSDLCMDNIESIRELILMAHTSRSELKPDSKYKMASSNTEATTRASEMADLVTTLIT